MTMFRTDPTTGELVRSNGALERVGGGEEVAQHVRIRHRLFAGECPFNLSLGMRYVGLILAKGTPPELVEQEFAQTALETPGVVQIDELTITTNADRSAEVEYSGSIDLDDAAERIPLHDKFTLQT